MVSYYIMTCRMVSFSVNILDSFTFNIGVSNSGFTAVASYTRVLRVIEIVRAVLTMVLKDQRADNMALLASMPAVRAICGSKVEFLMLVGKRSGGAFTIYLATLECGP